MDKYDNDRIHKINKALSEVILRHEYSSTIDTVREVYSEVFIEVTGEPLTEKVKAEIEDYLDRLKMLEELKK